MFYSCLTSTDRLDNGKANKTAGKKDRRMMDIRRDARVVRHPFSSLMCTPKYMLNVATEKRENERMQIYMYENTRSCTRKFI